jgi:hypothetical protein
MMSSVRLYPLPMGSRTNNSVLTPDGRHFVGYWTLRVELLFADLEDREEGFLRDIDLADALHALLAFFLLL